MGYRNTITRTHSELDLLNKADVDAFFEAEKPEYVFLAAAKVGGILANSRFPADFIYQNMIIGFNVVHAAFQSGAKKLMNLGSSCIYPKMSAQPMREEYLLTGPLEPTNDAYALAKISVIKLCTSYNMQYGTNYLSAMPTNLYGPGDNYDPEDSHVLAALIRKFHEAKVSGADEVVLWGDGSPYREFLYSDDLARAAVFLMNYFNADDLRTESGDFVNVGTGKDLTISELAEAVKKTIYTDSPGRKCGIVWDKSKPNGTPRKLLDVSRLKDMGCEPITGFADGLRTTYEDFLLHV
jgi:GDP-L-fucose synthase